MTRVTSSRLLPRSSTRWRTGDHDRRRRRGPRRRRAPTSAMSAGRRSSDGATSTSAPSSPRASRCPAALANDLAALMEAEHWFGDGRSVEHFAVLTIGASVGGGLVVHDRLVTGRRRRARAARTLPDRPARAGLPRGTPRLRPLADVDRGGPVAGRRWRSVATCPTPRCSTSPRPATPPPTASSAPPHAAFGTLIAAVANIALPRTGDPHRRGHPPGAGRLGAPARRRSRSAATPRRPRSTSGCSTTTRSCGPAALRPWRSSASCSTTCGGRRPRPADSPSSIWVTSSPDSGNENTQFCGGWVAFWDRRSLGPLFFGCR